MRFHFLPHKFGRLLLPWLLLIGLAATLLMPTGGFRSSVLTLASVTVFLGLFDVLLPRTFLLRKVSSPVRSFMVLNLASLLSVLVFMVPPEVLWRPTRIPAPGSPVLEPHPRSESLGNVLKPKSPHIEP
jgi:hypothetical protein